MNPNVDLRQLAVQRESPKSPRTAPGRRNLLTRYVIPGAVVLGFLGVVAWSARGSLLPSRPVTVVPVLATRAEVQEAGTPLFQAAGWVEPRPTPTIVTALAEGVVDQLLVVEGQAVKAGEPVARLLDADARLLLNAAESDFQLREADLSGAQVNLAAARSRLAQPLQLTAAHADAEALLARSENELANLPFQLRAAESRQKFTKVNFDGKTAVIQAVAGFAVSQAQSELDTAIATVEEVKGRQIRLVREVEALTRKRDALGKQLELKTEETRQAGEAEAQVRAAEARLMQARTAVETAKLRLERMTVRAPLSGNVLALVARPGTRVMGLSPGSLYDSSTVVMLYDPLMLQVRADIPFDQVARVLAGQSVRIETDAAPGGPLEGIVLYKTSQADMQKNTLQAKVAIKSPPIDLKPDMLVRLTFLAVTDPKAKGEKTEQLRFLVPRQLIDSAEGGSRVWVADQVAGVARARTVKLGPGSGDFAEVVEGLAETDKVIAAGREGIKDGDRIQVTGEDTQGVATGNSAPATKRVKRLVPGDASQKGK